ncbi:MAG TPA: hypothetical protein PK177_13565 [Burkholderiaceae bacterium]|nr:hypothetical protein [Burkholderiaceae bacterium]
MFVDLIPLRVAGRPRSRDELAAAEPVRGDVIILRTRESRMSKRYTARFALPNGVHPLPEMVDVRLVAMDRSGFVVTGYCDDLRQSWWCRPAERPRDTASPLATWGSVPSVAHEPGQER